jgi:two-component system, chemotaxis family, sensor kinase CheA
LVGQAAAEKQLIVSDVPDDALVVSTGLVEMLPRQIVVAPFETNGQVIGVLELAGLNTFTPTQLNFLKLISESIGVAFKTAQERIKMATLLTETQMQAEELQAQEEELRAANEELQAQAENLKLAHKSAGKK